MEFTKEISDRFVEVLMASALDAVVAVDKAGILVAWNPVAQQIFGWSREEAVGRPMHELIVPAHHRDAHQAGMSHFLETGEVSVVGRRIEISALNRDGMEFPVELSIVEAPTGGEAAFIGFIRDISDRAAAQAELMLSEESFRLATDAAEIGTWDLDIKTDTLTWSDRTKAMFGISPEAPASMVDFYNSLHPEDLEATSLAFAGALDPLRRSIYDVTYRTIGKEDGKLRWVAAKGKGIFNKDGVCVRAIGTAIDITAATVRDQRTALLNELTELLRRPDTSAALDTACELMGIHFGVSRVGYGLLDADEDLFTYTTCWTNGAVPPLLGKFPAHIFGEKIVACLSGGGTVVVNDLMADTLSDEARTRQTAEEVDTRSILVVPFLRGGRLRTIVYLNSSSPREWSQDEVDFMEAVARRTQQLIDKAETEAVIAAKDAEFMAFAQAMPNHAWMSDADGLLYWFNDQVYNYTGAKPGGLDGIEWASVVHEDDRESAGAVWMKALEAGLIYETQFRIRSAAGDYRWHLIRAVPIRNPSSEIVSWIGTNTDIHDQKMAEEAFFESQLRMRSILDSAGEAFYATDTEGHTTLCNQALVRLLGFGNEDEAIGRKLHDVVHHTHPDGTNYPKADCPIFLCASTGVPAHVTGELFFRLDGTSFPVEYRASPIYRDGILQGTICTFTDISDRLAAERQLKSLNETLEQRVREAIADRDRIWHNSRDLLVVVDTEGVFHSVNPAWADVLGHDPAFVKGRNFKEFIWPEDADDTQGALATAVSGENLNSYVNRYLHVDGKPRWISWSTTREADFVYAYGRDVTGIKAKEAELEQTQSALRQAQKMEAVGQLTGGIAHDFNNMLAVVSGSLELLDRRISGEDIRSKRHIASALEASRRSANLTQRLLAFSRQQPLRPEVLNPNKLVAGMSDLFSHSLGGQIRLETVLGAGIWNIHVDQNELENVLLNLAVNGRDAMPDGGKLTIETQNASLDERYVIHEPGLAAGQYVLIAVTDNGTGMPDHVIEKAFDPFFTTKEVGKGTGLGLSQVYGFVKQSGGHIQVYSEMGVGTTIKIYLPRYMGPDQVEAARSPEEIASGEYQELILVVDDEAIVRQFSVDALTDLGYRVLQADCAEAALVILKERLDIDLLFTDIIMPEHNGRRLAEAARVLRPDLPIVYTTGYTRNAVVHNGVVDTGVELITKPFTLEDLAAKIRFVLDASHLKVK